MALALATEKTNIRYLLKESSAGFFLDAEIELWISQAALDISVKTLCYEAISTITLAASTLEYSEPTGCLKIAAIHYNNKPLTRIHPKMIGAGTNRAAGAPEQYYHFADKIGLWPLVDAVAAVTSPRVFHAASTSDVTKIADQFGVFVEIFALMMAKLKEEKLAQAAALNQIYLNSLLFYRQDLVEQTVDAKAEQRIPDYNEIVRAAKG